MCGMNELSSISDCGLQYTSDHPHIDHDNTTAYEYDEKILGKKEEMVKGVTCFDDDFKSHKKHVTKHV
jgi:hypothetical protein